MPSKRQKWNGKEKWKWMLYVIGVVMSAFNAIYSKGNVTRTLTCFKYSREREK